MNYSKNKTNMNSIKQIIQNSKFKIQNCISIVALLLLVSSCVKYSLSGGDTGTAQTITIRNFTNDAGGGPPNLSQLFSEKLRDYYQQNSKLQVVNESGDWMLEGNITAYTITPIAPTGTETAGLSRLTIVVKATFTNNKEGPNEIKSFESDFSFYRDFPQSQSLSAVETELVNDILDRIVFDLFSRTTSNW
jgi:hypothetical protein